MTGTPEETLIELRESSDYMHVIYSVKKLLAHIGFDEIQQSLVASAASELSTNIIRYAGCGTVMIKEIDRDGKTGIEITACDDGPGIGDINKVLQDHFSTGNGLGLGLPSVKRIMDDFQIKSAPGNGTRIRVRKWR